MYGAEYALLSRRLLTLSIDRTIRTYTLPDFEAHLVLEDHRAAVNAVSISDDLIVSGSGDRSMKLWDATNGDLLQSHENHHGRGCVLFAALYTPHSDTPEF